MELISPDKKRCVKCNACSEICPMNIIGTDTNGYPIALENANKLCINCGYCVDVCAFKALFHRVRKVSPNAEAAYRAAVRRLSKRREKKRLMGSKK